MRNLKITNKAIDYLEKDAQFKEHVIEKVIDFNDFWEIGINNGLCMSIPKTEFTPRVGMTARFYGKGFGYPVRGVTINFTPIFYRTPEEAENDHKRYCKKLERDSEKRLKANKKAMDADYDALPDVFKQRIDRFRVANPNFRRDYESYEMFTIKEAIKIANAVKDPDKIDEFHKKSFEEQVKIANIDEGHSGNTFGCACQLAMWYLKNPENVIKLHGALVPVVGCKAYGCSH